MFIVNDNYIKNLFGNNGILINHINIVPLKGGNNNKVYSIICDSKKYLLKKYYFDELDARDRIGTEYRFLNYCDSIKCPYTPKPLFYDFVNKIGVIEFIEGDQPALNLINEFHLMKAIDFWKLLNIENESKEKQVILPAIDSCFSLDDHINSISKRVHKLYTIKEGNNLQNEVYLYVNLKLIPTWIKLVNKININSSRSFFRNNSKFLSPSDFGFHNSIISKSNRITFIDFEYAGFDDPAKMICDFVNHPNLNLTVELKDKFIYGISNLVNDNLIIHRTVVLDPLIKMKWACICLNKFLPENVNKLIFISENQPEILSNMKDFYLKSLNIYNTI